MRVAGDQLLLVTAAVMVLMDILIVAELLIMLVMAVLLVAAAQVYTGAALTQVTHTETAHVEQSALSGPEPLVFSPQQTQETFDHGTFYSNS